jgi:hypothetical protein
MLGYQHKLLLGGGQNFQFHLVLTIICLKRYPQVMSSNQATSAYSCCNHFNMLTLTLTVVLPPFRLDFFFDMIFLAKKKRL